MSYILEALKKLEQKRRSGETSPLLAGQFSSPRSAAKRPVLLYFLLAALSVNAGLLLWWLHPWSSVKPVEPVTVSVSAASAVKDDDALKPAKTGTQSEETESVGLQPNAVNKPADKLSSAAGGPAENVLSQPPRLSSDDSSAERKVIEMSELPLSVSQRLPDLAISGHFYGSRPSSRVITVGGRMLHEGAAAAPGVKLEKITPNGAVFSFEGYRFRKEVF
jgi:general secretion pathway protein B